MDGDEAENAPDPSTQAEPEPTDVSEDKTEGSSGGTKKSRKSKTGEKIFSDGILSFSGNAIEWDDNGELLGMDVNWVADDPGVASPSVWDPKQFDEQTGSLDPWKESNEITRVQDLPTPALVDSPLDQRTGDEDEWPFKSPCSFQEKRKRRSRMHFSHTVSSDVDSVVSPRLSASKSKGKKSKKSEKTDDASGNGDTAPAPVRRSTSTDGINDEDIVDEESDPKGEAWKMRESWKSSAHSESEVSKGSKGSKEGRRGRKKDSEPAMPRRSRASRPDAEDDTDNPPAQSKNRSKSDNSAEPDDDDDDDDDDEIPDEDKSKKTKRRTGRTGPEEGEDGKDELGNSFHRLAKDFDKPSRPRSTSRGRKTKTPVSGGSGRRRRLKDKGMDNSGHDDDHSEVCEEFGEEEHEVRLKDSDGSSIDPGSAGSGRSRMTWRERRARNRVGEEPSGEGPDHTVVALKAPGSGGRRPPRRGMMRRASSERWKRAVENLGEDDPDAIQNRARTSLMNANAELSRSAHSIRRYHSGGVASMASGLDVRSYHGPEGNVRRQPLRTPRKQIRSTPKESADSGGSFGHDYDDYELNLSGRSNRTLDSIEDLEDFEQMDFQTPGMVDYDEEILELMQRANPEHTAQLNRRVHRKREAVNYDQNMPMMTRQALLTRQASAQVARQRFDGSNIDRKRLLLRSDSMSSTDGAEMSLSGHRPLRTTPGRRPPPRTRSSGMAAMARNDVPGFMQQQPTRADPDRSRGVLRTRSSAGAFRQYYNKPNKVAQMSRRGPGDQIDPHSMRGTTKSSSDLEPQRGSLQRAKSTTALRPARKLDPRSVPAEPSIPTKVETKEKVVSSDSEEEKFEKTKKETKAAKEDSSSESDSEDSDVESIESETESPRKPARRAPTRVIPPKSPTPTKKVKKSIDKRDMLHKRNRCKLHAMMYEVKMSVDMKDLFDEVQKGEIPKSPIKSLMMPSP